MMTIDDLRALLPADAKRQWTDDDHVLDFYCWQDARSWAQAMHEDNTITATTSTLRGWFANGLPKAEIADVKDWLDSWFGPDQMALTNQDMLDLIEEYKKS